MVIQRILRHGNGRFDFVGLASSRMVASPGGEQSDESRRP